MLNDNSLAILRNVDKSLASVIRRAALMSKHEFQVVSGRVDMDTQIEQVLSYEENVYNSMRLIGCSVDILAEIDKASKLVYNKIADYIELAAKDLKINVIRINRDYFTKGNRFELERTYDRELLINQYVIKAGLTHVED